MTGGRSTKRLPAATRATAFMRDWFAGLRAEVAGGAPLALVNADAPQEIFRAAGIPYVVVQWWSSVIAAKQAGPAASAALAELGYPDDSDQYSALPLGASFLPDERAPWGGLPQPSIVLAELTGDTTAPIGHAWARHHDATFWPLESAASPEIVPRWWERIDDEWETVVGSRRIDLMVSELEDLIEFCATELGRPLDDAALGRVLDLVNEQALWNRRTRDLVARTTPAPVDLADSVPAVMIPQWHRGTEWGRDAAVRLYHEVAARVATSDAVVADERIRLMWIGRGLWFDPGFTQRFQASHGAVFVWSMYLAIAADGYVRRGADRLRTVAARFAAFSELLGMPGWADEWYVHEARHHDVDGVVHLTAPESRSAWFVTEALERAGIPVLEIDANNVDARGWDGASLERHVAAFIEDRVDPVAARRRAGGGATP